MEQMHFLCLLLSWVGFDSFRNSGEVNKLIFNYLIFCSFSKMRQLTLAVVTD